MMAWARLLQPSPHGFHVSGLFGQFHMFVLEAIVQQGAQRQVQYIRPGTLQVCSLHRCRETIVSRACGKPPFFEAFMMSHST